MRYRELHLETRREHPARAKTMGRALLIRAGYLTLDSKPTALGLRAISRLAALADSTKDFFQTIGIPVVATSRQEFLFQMTSADCHILRCSACGYADILDLARFAKPVPEPEPMLPIRKIITPECSTIESLAAFLGVPKEKTAKALMYTRASDRQFVIAVVRGDTQISERKLSDVVGQLQPAKAEEMARSGAVPGYASPIGLKDTLVIVDDLIARSANLVSGANQAGYHFQNVNFGRDYQAQEVTDLALAKEGDACPNCGAPMAALRAIVLRDRSGYRLEDVLLSLAETYHDEHGLCLPASSAPFEVYLMHLPSPEADTVRRAEGLYQDLISAGISVLYDDREERAGVKFNDADLIGCPIRLTVSERSLKQGMVEFKARNRQEILLLPSDDALETIRSHSQILQ